ncbi:MAG: hypothetical protein J6J79_09150 [Lachnospiraceae bacterium]|nr:hypothetical protein [Lachnospiraceae bacterium]
MTSLLVAKQYIKMFISKYEVYVKPLLKLILALAALMIINAKVGYMQKIDSLPIVLMVALMCSFMPMNFIVFISAVFLVLHMYALSLEAAVITLVLLAVLYLLYLRFSPKDTLAVLLTPLSFAVGVPYAMPLAMGLLGTPVSAISVCCGVVVTFLVCYMSDNATVLAGMETEDMSTKFRFIIDGFLDNKGMILTIVAFSAAIIVVYMIRRMSIDYAWTMAIAAGAITDIMILLIGDFIFDTNISILGLIVGSIFAVLIAKVVEFFGFNVDYSRTEKVQFEDDEYYYYVKAVPKVTVAAPARTVKKINSSRRRPTR